MWFVTFDGIGSRTGNPEVIVVLPANSGFSKSAARRSAGEFEVER
jgi:hypothetical protein